MQATPLHFMTISQGVNFIELPSRLVITWSNMSRSFQTAGKLESRSDSMLKSLWVNNAFVPFKASWTTSERFTSAHSQFIWPDSNHCDCEEANQGELNW